jgi:hypothetical protein
MEKIKALLAELAAKKVCSDDSEFMVHDWAGGNIDDAYQLGCDDGERLLARQILEDLNALDNPPKS